MSMKKQNGNQSNATLSKPVGNRTVLSPRARGKRASNKMGGSAVKDKEKTTSEDKEFVKDDVDRESEPLSEKEAHMDKKDIFRSDSTLSNSDLVVTSIPNVVPTEGDNFTGNILEGSDTEANKGDMSESKNVIDENAKESELTHSLTQEQGDTHVTVQNVDDENGTKTTNSSKGSTVSINSKENKNEAIKTSTVPINSKEINAEAAKNITDSSDSKPALSKAGSVQSKESKGDSVKGSTVSVNSKETKNESRPSSMKKTNKKPTISSVNASENETNKTSTPNGVKKGIYGSKSDKLNGGIEPKVKISEVKCNGKNHNTPNDTTINSGVSMDVVSLTVPGQAVDNPEKQSPNAEVRKDSVVGDSLRRESTKFSFGSRKSVDIRVQYTAVQMPTTEDKTKPSVYATDDSWIRIAIPYMPLGVAILCLCLNICVPGLGTMISGFSIFCCGVSRVPSKYDQDAIVILCVNIWVGVAQLFTVSFMLVGWFWSLAWGIKMVILAVERRQELKDRRAKELQTLALKAFGSSIPAAHMNMVS